MNEKIAISASFIDEYNRMNLINNSLSFNKSVFEKTIDIQEHMNEKRTLNDSLLLSNPHGYKMISMIKAK